MRTQTTTGVDSCRRESLPYNRFADVGCDEGGKLRPATTGWNTAECNSSQEGAGGECR